MILHNWQLKVIFPNINNAAILCRLQHWLILLRVCYFGKKPATVQSVNICHRFCAPNDQALSSGCQFLRVTCTRLQEYINNSFIYNFNQRTLLITSQTGIIFIVLPSNRVHGRISSLFKVYLVSFVRHIFRNLGRWMDYNKRPQKQWFYRLTKANIQHSIKYYKSKTGRT